MGTAVYVKYPEERAKNRNGNYIMMENNIKKSFVQAVDININTNVVDAVPNSLGPHFVHFEGVLTYISIQNVLIEGLWFDISSHCSH